MEASLGEVILLPQKFSTPAEQTFIVERYKALRLQSLKHEPEAFSSTYEDESQFPDDVWVQRIKNPLGKTFVVVRSTDSPKDYDPTGSSVLAKLNREWVASCVLIGPKVLPLGQDDPQAALWAFTSSSSFKLGSELDVRPHSALAYCPVAMYVLPGQRRLGLGRKLMDVVTEAAREEAKELQASKSYLTIFFETDNHRACQLYEKSGFTMVGVEEFPIGKEGTMTRPVQWGWILT